MIVSPRPLFIAGLQSHHYGSLSAVLGEPINITNGRCPSSQRRRWDQNVRSVVLPNVFKLAGLVPFNDWGGGAVEPVVWILGGDLNLGENTIHNEVRAHLRTLQGS